MKIAIQANPSRGKEIISLLESLGGIKTTLRGDGEIYTYYIDEYNKIRYANAPKDYKVYTLEEFEEEFPFKIGDKVTIVGLPDFPKVITQMMWYCDEVLYSFEDLNSAWFDTKALKKFEMKEERNITFTLDKAKEWYKKGGELKEIALQAFTETELNPLPRSWKEFCDKYSKTNDKEYFIDADSNIEQVNAVVPDHCRLINSDRNICPSKKSAEAHLAMMQLEQLGNCWRQGWVQTLTNTGYRISRTLTGDYTVLSVASLKYFLAFPTKEMAEEFLKCFRDLIEKAGDLI